MRRGPLSRVAADRVMTWVLFAPLGVISASNSCTHPANARGLLLENSVHVMIRTSSELRSKLSLPRCHDSLVCEVGVESSRKFVKDSESLRLSFLRNESTLFFLRQ